MTPCTLYLITSRNEAAQRAHFAIFVPAGVNPDQRTLIEAMGAPMTGYTLESKGNYCPAQDHVEDYEIMRIGETDSQNVVDDETGLKYIDQSPRDDIELVASGIPTPGICENFLAPVNESSNQRDQEWTLEYIRLLVGRRLISSEAIQVVYSKRDPPTHGLRFQPSIHRSS